MKHDRKRVTLLQSTTALEHTSPLVFDGVVEVDGSLPPSSASFVFPRVLMFPETKSSQVESYKRNFLFKFPVN